MVNIGVGKRHGLLVRLLVKIGKTVECYIFIPGKIPVLKLLIQLYLQEMTKMTKGKIRKKKVYLDLKKRYVLAYRLSMMVIRT